MIRNVKMLEIFRCFNFNVLFTGLIIWGSLCTLSTIILILFIWRHYHLRHNHHHHHPHHPDYTPISSSALFLTPSPSPSPPHLPTPSSASSSTQQRTPEEMIQIANELIEMDELPISSRTR